MVYYDLGQEELAEKMFKLAKEGPFESAGYDQKETKIRILISLSSIFLNRAIQ
jgi:hypothetical protein